MKKILFLFEVTFLCVFVLDSIFAQKKPLPTEWFARKSNYSIEAQQYFNRLVILPGQDTLVKMAEFIDSLKQNGVWAKVDEMWLLANKTSSNALIGIKNKKNCVSVNSPSFAVYRGFTSNGTTSYLSTQFNLGTDGVNYIRNSASIGVYSRTNSSDVGLHDMGCVNSGTDRVFLQTRSGTNFAGRLNEADGDVVSNSDSRGFFIINRSGVSATQYYKNGTNLKSGTTSSTGVPSVIIYILCRNGNGTPGDFSTKQISFALIGGSLSSQDVTNFNNCLERLLDYLGAGVQ